MDIRMLLTINKVGHTYKIKTLPMWSNSLFYTLSQR